MPIPRSCRQGHQTCPHTLRGRVFNGHRNCVRTTKVKSRVAEGETSTSYCFRAGDERHLYAGVLLAQQAASCTAITDGLSTTRKSYKKGCQENSSPSAGHCRCSRRHPAPFPI